MRNLIRKLMCMCDEKSYRIKIDQSEKFVQENRTTV